MKLNIIPVKDLGNTPARVNRRTGTVYLNCKIWDKIPEAHRKIIFLHEKGHYVYDTSDEFLADDYAFEHFAGKEKYSVKKFTSFNCGLSRYRE